MRAVLIRELKRPNKRSGMRLEPGKILFFNAMGLEIRNKTSGSAAKTYYVDRRTPKKPAKKRKARK